MHFSQKYKPADELINIVNIIITNIKNSLKNSILKNSWMSETTKSKSIDKLNVLTIDIHDVANINPKLKNLKSDNSFLKNILKSSKILQKKKIKKILCKKKEYIPDLNIYEINAFYTPLFNKIIIPIGILIDPIATITQSMSSNFAGIGIILGHEIIHGFDTNGCNYDKHGNFNNLLDENDYIIYNQLVDKFKKQFNNKNINIELTLNENIADLGGINLSIKGLSNYLDSINVIDKKEEYKNFFIHYAKMWKSKSIKEDLHIILNDTHSPPDIRVNNMLSNIDEFYYAFDIKEGDTLFLKPEDRIFIW